MNKKRIAVVFGGKSQEHEVSLCSAGSVIKNLDKSKFDIFPLYIDKQGSWWHYPLETINFHSQTNSILPQQQANPFVASPESFKQSAIDVIFPVIHGPLCEDGSLQGFFEILELPYVGANVLGSALGMDKAISKILVKQAGIAVAPFIVFSGNQWLIGQENIVTQILTTLKKPYFVKPTNTGSSVGVSKVTADNQLIEAIQHAFRYHDKVIIEQGIIGREIEVSVLDSLEPPCDPLASLPGEVKISDGFYSYDRKYIHPEEVELIMPAQLTESETTSIQQAAIKSYQALQTEIMARVDVFLEEGTGTVYFNEINTLPGFTKISMYPLLWQISGINYPTLLATLIDLAIARHQKKNHVYTQSV